MIWTRLEIKNETKQDQNSEIEPTHEPKSVNKDSDIDTLRNKNETKQDKKTALDLLLIDKIPLISSWSSNLQNSKKAVRIQMLSNSTLMT